MGAQASVDCLLLVPRPYLGLPRPREFNYIFVKDFPQSGSVVRLHLLFTCDSPTHVLLFQEKGRSCGKEPGIDGSFCFLRDEIAWNLWQIKV